MNDSNPYQQRSGEELMSRKNHCQTIRCRAASTPEEKQIAFSIRHNVFVEEQGVPLQIERDDKDGKAIHFLAVVNNEPVGTARLVVNEDGTGTAGRVAVVKNARHLGIGSSLMNELEHTARRLNLSRINLAAQCDVIPFYLKRGYIPFGGTFIDAGIAHQSMSLTL